MEKTLEQHPSSCIKVVLFGPESSGKTTMAKLLALEYETSWVPEYMRLYLQEKWDTQQQKISKDDLLPIAEGQIALENIEAMNANKFLFCDTNVRELKVYSKYYYKDFCPSEILEAVENNTYHHYFLTQIDTPWELDDLRDRPYEREKLFCIFEEELIKNNLPYTLLEGSQEQRLQKATQVLTTLEKELNAQRK